MPGPSTLYYWDTCLFLAWLKDEERKVGEMDGVREKTTVGRVLLITYHARIITSNYHALSTYLRNLLVHTMECVFSIRSINQWIDLSPSQLPPPIATLSPTYQPQQ